MEFSLLGMWAKMGLMVKALMFLLAGMSVYTLAVMLERALVLRRGRAASAIFAGLVDNDDPNLKMAQVIKVASDPERGKYCFLGQVVLASLKEAQLLSREGQGAAVVFAAAQDTLARAIVLTVAQLRKRLVTLATAASGAPFIGLFATIMGLIRSFQEIATTESGGIGAVSAGIGEALIGTLVGLFVAIPAMWAYNFFADQVDGMTVELNSTAGRLVERVLRRELMATKA